MKCIIEIEMNNDAFRTSPCTMLCNTLEDLGREIYITTDLGDREIKDNMGDVVGSFKVIYD